MAGLACRQLHKDAHLLVINDEQEQLAVAKMLSGLSLSLLTVLCCFLSPEMRLCFTRLSVCLSVYLSVCMLVCLSVDRITRKLLIRDFTQWSVIIHRPNNLIFNDLDPRSKSVEVKRSKSFSRITLFKIIAQSHGKLKCGLYNSPHISKEMLKTYQFKTHCKDDGHSSKTANIILPGLMIIQR